MSLQKGYATTCVGPLLRAHGPFDTSRFRPEIPGALPMAPAKRTATSSFASRVREVRSAHEKLLRRRNPIDLTWHNGVYERFQNPVLTAAHAPIEWRYDFDRETNPFFMERLGINATLNPGAFLWKGKVCLVVRVEGSDRKSFFGIAESPTVSTSSASGRSRSIFRRSSRRPMFTTCASPSMKMDGFMAFFVPSPG